VAHVGHAGQNDREEDEYRSQADEPLFSTSQTMHP
jgi:hypothetical protein